MLITGQNVLAHNKGTLPRKKLISVLASASITVGTLSLLPGTSHAENGRGHQQRHSYTEYADVVDVRPIYKDVRVQRPERQCWTEQPSHSTVYEGHNHQRNQQSSSRDNKNPVLGGLIGGAIGNQIGKAAGGREARIGATIVGAVLGSVIANESPSRDRRERGSRRDRRERNSRHQHKQQRHSKPAPIERCSTQTVTHIEQKIDGYNVTYRYRGRNYQMHSHQHPGDRIALDITVRPQRG